MNPYSYSSNDSAECKQLACGRTPDVDRIVRNVCNGQSIALFGERRIGKSFLLWIVRDILKGTIQQYSTTMLDDNLKKWINESMSPILESTSKKIVAVEYLTLQKKEILTTEDLQKLVTEKHPALFTPGEDLYGSFKRISKGTNGRIIFMLDEMEVVCALQNAKSLLRQLRSVIQEFDNVCFIFAGAEDWLREIQDSSSPLYGVCTSHFLSVPCFDDTEQFLLMKPLAQFLPDPVARKTTVTLIMKETGGKPYYCQVFGYELALGIAIEKLVAKVESCTSFVINDTFDSPSSLSHRILVFLAHCPEENEKSVAKKLGETRELVSNALKSMEQIGKVELISNKWRIRGQLIQRWGKANFPNPRKKTFSAKKILAISILSLVALFIWVDSNPEQFPTTISSDNVAFLIVMPSTVESGESGSGTISIRPLRKLKEPVVIKPSISACSILPTSGNSWKFLELEPNIRSESQTLNYSIPAQYHAKYAVFTARTNLGEELELKVRRRILQTKRFCTAITTVLATVTGLILFWEKLRSIWSQISNHK